MRKENHNLTTGIFWYWNSDPTPEGIRKQLAAIKEAGFHCVYLHPMPDAFHKNNFFQGMTLGYLGKKFFALAGIMLAECKRLKLIMMLYDEGGWPSGGVLNRLVKQHPECRSRYLVKNADGNGYSIERDDNPDLFDAHSTRCFIEMTHELYQREFGSEFGKTIRGIFTDEPFWCCVPGREKVRISDGIPTLLKEIYNVSFDDILPLLFAGAPDGIETEEARRKYMDVCSRLISKNYAAILSGWCERNHLDLEGHFDGEDKFFFHFRNGDFMRLLETFQVPGVDLIWRQAYPGISDGNFARFASAVAIRNHRPEALCECFNVYGYYLTPKIMNWVANTLLVKGINRILPMPHLYSDIGRRKICCSTDISPRNPIWDAMPALNAFWNWAGNYNAGALQPAVWLLAYCEHPVPDNGQLPEQNCRAAARMEEIIRQLDDAGVFWRFANGADLESTRKPDVLIAPYPIHDDRTREQIRNLEKSGVRVIADATGTELKKYSPVEIERADGCRILPCLRPEGEALMIFNPSNEVCEFRFRSGENWKELLPPDSAPSELRPIRDTAGTVSVPLAPGELRILKKGIASAVAATGKRRFPELKWAVVRVEKIHYSKTGRTHYTRETPACELPASGYYTDLEKDFSGRIVLKTVLESPYDEEAFLEFGEICFSAALRLNGEPVGLRAFAPWVFKGRLHKGLNHLELTISSSGGNEWRRCFREELEPAGWFNCYVERFRTYQIDDARCGLTGKITLTLKKRNSGNKKYSQLISTQVH